MQSPDSQHPVELTVSDIVYPGRGLARLDNLVVFIEGVLLHERVRARITRRRKRFAEATLLEVLTPSPLRQPPPCPLALRAENEMMPDALSCPGCSYQHAAYEEEVRCKDAQLDNLIERLGGGPAEGRHEAPVAAPLAYGYRNKIVLHTTPRDATRTGLGYVGRDNRTVIPVAHCPLACPEINAKLTTVLEDQQMLGRLKPGTDVTFRYTPADGVQVWTGKTPHVKKWLTETTGRGALRIPLTGFYQVNPPVADRLRKAVEKALREEPPQAVIDAYCGAGLFALIAAQCGVPAVLGIDIDDASIRAARHNARARQLDGVEFVRARADQVLRDALDPVPAADTLLILDPPRRGLDADVTEQIVQHGPARILYISCAPDTLARDLKRLRQGGYRIASRQLHDMFPRTAHFETLVALSHSHTGQHA